MFSKSLVMAFLVIASPLIGVEQKRHQKSAPAKAGKVFDVKEVYGIYSADPYNVPLKFRQLFQIDGFTVRGSLGRWEEVVDGGGNHIFALGLNTGDGSTNFVVNAPAEIVDQGALKVGAVVQARGSAPSNQVSMRADPAVVEAARKKSEQGGIEYSAPMDIVVIGFNATSLKVGDGQNRVYTAPKYETDTEIRARKAKEWRGKVFTADALLNEMISLTTPQYRNMQGVEVTVEGEIAQVRVKSKYENFEVWLKTEEGAQIRISFQHQKKDLLPKFEPGAHIQTKAGIWLVQPETFGGNDYYVLVSQSGEVKFINK
jgi:hypothetical protein